MKRREERNQEIENTRKLQDKKDTQKKKENLNLRRGRPKIDFKNLSKKYQNVLSARALRYLQENYAGVSSLVKHISATLKIRPKETNYHGIRKFSQIYLPLMKNESRIAAFLTSKMNLRLASEITEIPMSSISWGRFQINQNSYYMNKSFVPTPSKASEAGRRWFYNLVLEFSPVKSGTVKKRELCFNCYSQFYNLYQIQASSSQFPVRSLNCVINWIKETEIKKVKFDKYKCEKCFFIQSGQRKI